MPSFEHTKLIERIAALDSPPDDEDEFAAWLKASGQLRLLRDNAQERELIISAIGENTFVNTVAVSENKLFPLNKSDLLSWNGNSFRSLAGYAWGGEEDDVRVESGTGDWSSKTLAGAMQLVFGRQLIGDDSGIYFEVLQEYSHITDSHWRPEQHAYCCFDEHGDIKHVASVTSRSTGRAVSLVSFEREKMEQYLAASGSVLVRMFDFTLVDRQKGFAGWSGAPATLFLDDDDLFFRQKSDPRAAYTRGVQIVRLSRSREELLQEIRSFGLGDARFVEFMALDWRNDRILTISTDPSATTNYFEAEGNSLPFETSVAFFSPDVLSKYKSDRDRYTVGEERRLIECRGGWSLRYGINDANQVHAYIVDLRELPHKEQQYWKSCNEEPKAGLSERAIAHDFKGEWSDIATPLEDVLTVLRGWDRANVAWWKLRDATLLERVNTPRTSSRDEWAGAFGDLASLVVEGFKVGHIRERLKEQGIDFEKRDKSLVLLEKFLKGHDALSGEGELEGLRTVQRVRTRTDAHARGRGAAQLSSDALAEHYTYAAHFESVCRTVTNELKMIEDAFA